MRKVCIQNMDIFSSPVAACYAHASQEVSLSELLDIVIESELTDSEKIIIRGKYYDNQKLSVISRVNNISNVYKVHDSAIAKLYSSLKYVVLFNVGAVGKFDDAFFKLVSVIAEKERM